MSNKKKDPNKQRIKMTAKILLGLVLSIVCYGVILNLGDTFKIPTTPCFYLGITEDLQPAKPCIDAISWQTYQFLLVILTIALTWAWYQVLNGKVIRKW